MRTAKWLEWSMTLACAYHIGHRNKNKQHGGLPHLFCGARGGLLDGREAARREIKGGGALLGFELGRC
jgi:hypothetical protein